MRQIDTRVVDGITYYSTVACDGWPTGPCQSAAKAIERVRAYEACEEVSQAAPGQASYAQMHAFLEALSSGHEGTALVLRAIESGLHTEDWAKASGLLGSMSAQPDMRAVIDAGGTWVRRRLPATRIPSRGAQ